MIKMSSEKRPWSFKSLLFKEDTQPEKEVVVSKYQEPIIPVPQPVVMSGIADPKIIEAISQSIDKANIPGPDYYEFRKTMDAMQKIGTLDDKSVYTSAYAALSIQGCTKRILISSIDTYMEVIDSEVKRFDFELNEQIETAVKIPLEKIQEINKRIESMQKEINDLSIESINLQAAANTEKLKIDSIAANFSRSVEIVKRNLLSDKEKIDTYIQEPTK